MFHTNHSAWVLYGETGKYYLAMKLNDILRKTHEHDVREDGRGCIFFLFQDQMDTWNTLSVATPECVDNKMKKRCKSISLFYLLSRLPSATLLSLPHPQKELPTDKASATKI